MICVIFTSKLEIPEDGYDVLDAKQFWYKVYALSEGDFDMLIQGRIQEFLIGGEVQTLAQEGLLDSFEANYFSPTPPPTIRGCML